MWEPCTPSEPASKAPASARPHKRVPQHLSRTPIV